MLFTYLEFKMWHLQVPIVHPKTLQRWPISRTQIQNISLLVSGIVLQQSNQSLLTSNMYSEAHQTLYGSFNGYLFTTYQPPSPHTTPAPVLTTGNQQIPSMPWPQTTPLTPLYFDLDRFMNDVTNKLKKLNVLDDIHSRLITLSKNWFWSIWY